MAGSELAVRYGLLKSAGSMQEEPRVLGWIECGTGIGVLGNVSSVTGALCLNM